VGVARQHAGITGQVENCQTVRGHRDYDWAWAAGSSPPHWILICRSLSDIADLAFYCHAPEGRAVSLTVLIKVTEKRWPVEECIAHGKVQADPGPAPGPAVALLPPPYRAVHVLRGAASHRPASPTWQRPARRHRRAADSLARHRETSSQRR
jgi:hypothetical protein